MAVTVTDNTTIPTNGQAESTATWQSSSTDSAYSGFQREGSFCLGQGGSNSDEHAFVVITSTDFSNRTLFGWMINGAPGSTAQIGFGLLLGDGTNDRVYAVGGNDNYGHFVNGWSGFRMDCSNLPATFRNAQGTLAPTITAITRIGYGMRYNIAAFGKIDNVFHDIIRYITNGNAALTISGGTTGDRGTFANIVTEDASTASNKAYGIIRRLVAGTKAYELTYGIEFGAATGDTYFEDSDFQLIILGTGMSAGNMDVDLVAGTGTNLFSLQGGVIVGVDTVSNWNMSAAFETLQFNRMTVSNLGTISFPSSGGTLREVKDCVFNNCGQVTIGNALTFTGNTFNGTTDANGALLLDNTADGTNLLDLTFTSDGTGHAIYITAPGTYTFDGFTFTGYGSTGTADAAIYNNSGGAVTINIQNGTAPTYRNGASATTTINASFTLTITDVWAESEIRLYETGTTTEVAGVENSGSTVGSNTDGSYSSGGTTFTSTGYTFTTADVGRQVKLTSGGLSGKIYKITAFTDANNVTVSPAFTEAGSTISFNIINPNFTYTYSVPVSNVDIVVHNLGYEYYRLENYKLNTTANSSIPIVQRADRYYSNP